MGRPSPLAAIMAPAATVVSPSDSKTSDLPLRNYPVPDNTESELSSTAVDEPPGLSDLETPSSLLERGLETPSSTIVEFGDEECKESTPAALRMAVVVSQFYQQSQPYPASGTSDARSSSRSVAPGSHTGSTGSTARKSRSTSRTQQPKTRRSGDSRTRNQSQDRVNLYLQGLPVIDPVKELSLELTSLHQRISGLQRVERDLLSENQQLAHQMASLKRQQDSQRRKWRDEFREREKGFQARIQALEERLVTQDREMAQYATLRAKSDSQLSDGEVAEWFTKRTAAWDTWVGRFAHHDPERLQSLHPVQLLEVCENVKTFVRLGDDGLPEELLDRDGTNGISAAHVLLHGMLANFIISETLESPFWVFSALSSNTTESSSTNGPLSPMRFGMDLPSWKNPVPPRNAHPPSSPRRMPGSCTTPTLTLDTKCVSSPTKPPLALGRSAMETVLGILEGVQQRNFESHIWRSQLMQTLSSGGMSLESDSVQGHERRRLVQSRKDYAKKLKERFLGGAARFLLQDQDAAGIEKLEKGLEHEIDLALKFSCQVWSRPEPLQIQGLRELEETAFIMSSDTMQLCRAQAPIDISIEDAGSDLPPAYHDGQHVVMVVEPVVGFLLPKISGGGQPSRVLSKAKVLVAAPGSNSSYNKDESTPLTARPIDGLTSIPMMVHASLLGPPPAPAPTARLPLAPKKQTTKPPLFTIAMTPPTASVSAPKSQATHAKTTTPPSMPPSRSSPTMTGGATARGSPSTTTTTNMKAPNSNLKPKVPTKPILKTSGPPTSILKKPAAITTTSPLLSASSSRSSTSTAQAGISKHHAPQAPPVPPKRSPAAVHDMVTPPPPPKVATSRSLDGPNRPPSKLSFARPGGASRAMTSVLSRISEA
ncbi:hypothetical protein QBC39DRAFT_101242 [Podospora conica]|nr:hypothetical protein QBC39DRAFT_101242 [Schizothecium conicum]